MRLIKRIVLPLLIILITLILFTIYLARGGAQLKESETLQARNPVAMGWDLAAFKIVFGLKDKEPTDWSGELSLQPGEVRAIWGWYLRGNDKLELEGNRFTLRTRRAGGQQAQQGPVRPVGLFAVIKAAANSQIQVNTKGGNFSFALGDMAIGQSQNFLEDQVQVSRTVPAFRLTESATEDDFPTAATAPNKQLWVAYVSYKPGNEPQLAPLKEPPKDFSFVLPKNNGDQLLLTRFDGQHWSAPLPITEPGLDVWKPAIAVDGNGIVWTIWSQNVEGNWDLYARGYDPKAERWEKPKRITEAPGTDINAVATTDKDGNVWIAWQGWRDGQSDILLAKLRNQSGQIEAPQRLSASQANDWNPAIAADSKGAIYVAFDTYDQGNYDVQLAQVNPFKENAIMRYGVADSPKFEARASITVDHQDRVWVGYEEGDPSWGKDYAGPQAVVAPFNRGNALYLNRDVKVKCFVNGKLYEPHGKISAQSPENLRRSKSFPRLGVDEKDRVWLLFRYATNPNGDTENWMSYATFYSGDRWSAPLPLPHSTNLMDMRPALAKTDGNNGKTQESLLAIYSSDGRQQGTGQRSHSDILAAILQADGNIEVPNLTLSSAKPQEESKYEPSHPNESEDVQRIRSYRLSISGRSYQFLRGEFHRHTEVSSHRDQDGTLEDMWRYGIDAAKLDWIGNGDHDNGAGQEYMWWLIQKMTDLYHHPDVFNPMFTYERSVVYPDGHRNVMFAKRGIRPLPRLLPQPGEQKENNVSLQDAKMLYRYLKEFNGICAIHTGATNMGTDWRDNDPVAEPIVEIYQGLRQNYEHLGAPRSSLRPNDSIGGWQPFGMVWNALAKGYRLGFESSSDHVSTHISYAIVAAEKPEREAILEAFQKRRCYAATDNIILDVNCGDRWMGEEFTLKEMPKLEVHAIGTQPIARIHIIKDFTYVYAHEPKSREAKFTWADTSARAGVSWYYVRLEQEDGQIAWGSPMWIEYKP